MALGRSAREKFKAVNPPRGALSAPRLTVRNALSLRWPPILLGERQRSHDQW